MQYQGLLDDQFRVLSSYLGAVNNGYETDQ